NRMTARVEQGDKTPKMDSHHVIDVVWTIQSVDADGKAKMTQRIERVRLAMDTPKTRVQFDSKDGKAADATLEPVRALIGLELAVTMDARGEISEVKLPDDALKVLKGPKTAGLGELFSSEGLKKMLNESVLPLPHGAVAKGKSWKRKLGLKLFGDVKLEDVY